MTLAPSLSNLSPGGDADDLTINHKAGIKLTFDDDDSETPARESNDQPFILPAFWPVDR